MAKIPWHVDAHLKVAGEHLASDTLWGIVGVWADLRLKEHVGRMAVICSDDVALYRRPPIPAGTAMAEDDLRMLAKKRPRQL